MFAMIIEILAISIRDNPDTQRVQCGPQSHKCALIADDILLFISSPITSLPIICRLLNDFGKVSGLVVNYSKSLALNINLPAQLVSQLKNKFRFGWTETALPYLGINLTATIDKLYSANFPEIFRKME